MISNRFEPRPGASEVVGEHPMLPPAQMPPACAGMNLCYTRMSTSSFKILP